MESNFRHEFKYIINEYDLALLQSRVKYVASLDPHVGEGGQYNISSLYFDDMFNTCFYENENGTDPREKFRIRIYNHDLNRITLECKRKERGKTLKMSCPLSLEQAEKLVHGEYLRENLGTNPTLLKFTEQMISRKLKPVVIVEYDRVPFVCRTGNVRVTFDMNLSSSYDVENFLKQPQNKRPVMPTGKNLLEVKYDEFMPEAIYDTLQVSNLEQTAYSKYYLCRKYNTKNIL